MHRAKFPNRVRISFAFVIVAAAAATAGDLDGFELASLASPTTSTSSPPTPPVQTLVAPVPDEAAPFELVALRFRGKSKSRCVCSQTGESCACRSGECGDGACRVRPAKKVEPTPPPIAEPEAVPEKLVLRRVVTGWTYRTYCTPEGCRTQRVPIMGEMYFRE